MKKIVFIFFIALIILELLIRVTGIYKTYSENISGIYVSPYHKLNKTFFTWEPSTTISYNQEEFNYINEINELGHRELPLDSFKNNNSVKILCLGDSFTEGDGAPYDSSWVRRFEHLLNQNLDTNFVCYNAGVCGSDIFFNYMILKEKLSLIIKLDVVIEALNVSDIDDVAFLGGAERFEDVNQNPVIKWEPIYKYSHVFRAFLNSFKNYDETLMNISDFEERRKNAEDKILKQAQKTAEYCKSLDIPYFLVIHPVPSEVIKLKKFHAYHGLFENEPYAIYLNSSFENYFKNNSVKQYAWELNGHFNSKGYILMGDFIFEELYENDLFLKSFKP